MHTVKPPPAFVQKPHAMPVDGRLSAGRQRVGKTQTARLQNTQWQGADHPIRRNQAAIGKTHLTRRDLRHLGLQGDVEAPRQMGGYLVEPTGKQHILSAKLRCVLPMPRGKQTCGAAVFLLQRAVDQIHDQPPQICIGALPIRRCLNGMQNRYVLFQAVSRPQRPTQKGFRRAQIGVDHGPVLV